MLKSPDLETERMNQVTALSSPIVEQYQNSNHVLDGDVGVVVQVGRSKPMERGRDGRSRPHSVHYTQHNGEADSDKENQAIPARGQMVAKAKSGPGQDTVITASTWLPTFC